MILTGSEDPVPADGKGWDKDDGTSISFPNMKGKDLLTGQKLDTQALAVSKANDAFYDAYESADLKVALLPSLSLSLPLLSLPCSLCLPPSLPPFPSPFHPPSLCLFCFHLCLSVCRALPPNILGF